LFELNATETCVVEEARAREGGKARKDSVDKVSLPEDSGTGKLGIPQKSGLGKLIFLKEVPLRSSSSLNVTPAKFNDPWNWELVIFTDCFTGPPRWLKSMDPAIVTLS